MDVSEAVASRRSVRGFLDRPVDPAILRRVLARAAAAPSGGNTQPWVIHVVAGGALAAFKAIMAGRLRDAPTGEGAEYAIYPDPPLPAYRARSRAVGEALYGHLGIPRDDRAGRTGWFAENYRFFGATAALFCFVDRRAGPPQWSDCGMYLQTLMLLLREEGLDSCAQECWAVYHRTVTAFVGAPPEQMLFTGMAIGWRDPDAPVNRLVPAREAVDDFATFHLGEDAPA